MHKYPIQKELLTTSPRTRCPPGIGRPTPSGLGSAQVNTVRRFATNRYKQYQPEDITAALYLVATSQASIIQAAKQFNIPTRTLYQRIYNIKKLYTTPSSGLRFSTGERATSVLVDPPRVDSSITNVATTKKCSFVSSFDEFKVNELGGFATSQPVALRATGARSRRDLVELCDSEGLKNLMLTSLHTSSLRVPSTFMSQ